ncbi:ATP-binding cassette domain-containing protein [Methylobacillus caricis]|uniref:peptidase domain-containing ABC transporter n=1 Tax=Methylobacillus caricis TaxID=1971611 RepID=UPI001CFF5F7F|nr:ATP-binding cassette domain-containing protein [Methylobacillus caricis]MCB5188830.1 ATP-binding cassette domain-containing protein [Methylobacillus caricis]
MENSTQKSSVAFSSLKSLLSRHWLEVGLSSLLINSGQILLPLFSMLVYDKIVSNGVFETLWALVIGMLIFIALDVGMRVTRNWTVERVAADMARKTDEGLWHKLLADRDMPSGGVATFLAHYRDLTNALNFVSSTYLLAIADLPFYLLYMLVIGFIAWPVMILVGVLTLLYAGIGYLLQLQTLRLNRETEHKSTQRMAYIGEVLQGMEIVRTVPGVTGLLQGWRTQSETVSELESARRLSASHSNTLSAGMMTFTTVSVLALGAYLIEARTLSVGGLIACSLLAARAMMLVTSLYLVLGKWEDFTRSAKRMDALLESGKQAQGVSDEVEQSAPHASFAVSKPQAKGDITLLRLTKRYPDRPAALENVTLNIVAGEKIGLLGRPGAGKTTLLKAIAGLSIMDEGEVLIDGYELHAISPADRAKWMAYKPQDPVLFAGTLEANLLLAGVKPQSERMEQALWASGLDEELRQGRLTLTMAIADRGSNLSGGQRQKVALARAFAQQSSILLLDEPSLGLDPEGEQSLAIRLPQLVGKGNLIMISHSAAMMSAVQRIVAMDGGKIVADGPKEKLLRSA